MARTQRDKQKLIKVLKLRFALPYSHALSAIINNTAGWIKLLCGDAYAINVNRYGCRNRYSAGDDTVCQGKRTMANRTNHRYYHIRAFIKNFDKEKQKKRKPSSRNGKMKREKGNGINSCSTKADLLDVAGAGSEVEPIF
ncbi:hypothetical protein DVR12_20395 [Chitinophaga silvatica]|uniref:Uncharacterized protein n=1 Tax=Chitinophaga silvatica TaxID=2282649 RepID=A0A3E1Y5U3_9BACT|nr:hypothetical protein DVR12_20395 [Chitinophaga silvatica]